MANLFTDREAPAPTPDVIAQSLGAAAPAWDALQNAVAEAGGATVWKWYRDGGWLARATRASKTLLWAQIDDAGFVDGAFHFAARLRESVAAWPGLDPGAAETVRTTELWGGMVSVTFELREPGDLDAAVRPLLKAKRELK